MRLLFYTLLLCFTNFVKSSTPIYTPTQLQKIFGIQNKAARQFRVGSTDGKPVVTKWDWDPSIDGYRIPYKIDDTYPVQIPGSRPVDIKRSLEKNIERAKEIYAAETSIRLMPKRITDTDYVEIVYNEDTTYRKAYKNDILREGGCWSHYGKLGNRQSMALGWCHYSVGSIIHEFMHVLGFMHEHQRHDRDEYIKVGVNGKYSEVNCEKANPLPDLLDKSVAGTVYDYDSIMHYPLYACNGMEVIDKQVNTKRFESLQINLINQKNYSKIQSVL